jgi:hypothetical protein
MSGRRLTLVAYAPAGDAFFWRDCDGALWLMTYSQQRRADDDEVSRAVTQEGFERSGHSFDSRAELDAELDRIAESWLAAHDDADDLADLTAAEARVIFGWSHDGPPIDGASRARIVATRLLKECPAVLEDRELHLLLVDAATAPTEDPLPAGEAAVRDRISLNLMPAEVA